MPRRARRGKTSGPAAPPRDGPLNAPFRELGRRLAARPPAAPPPPPPPPAPIAPPPVDDDGLFASAMHGVQRLEPDAHGRVARPGPGRDAGRPTSDDDEALAALSDLVAGTGGFDVTDTREYVEGAVVGLDPRVLRKLRRGDFAWQAFVDLHGQTAAEARDAVERFVLESFRLGRRCVLIVHGRGLNSKDQIPVLKERLKSWLAHGRIGKVVLAFATARAVDGGAGALYVLLRRDRAARPIQVTEGAKR